MTGETIGIDARLARAHAQPPDEPAHARASISPCREAGELLMISGQVAFRDGTLLATGAVGAEVDLDTARRCARQCALNILSAAQRHLGSLERVRSVLSLSVFVASAPQFCEQHLVADAASALLAEVVGGELPIRVALGMAALPLDSPVEVQAILQLSSAEG